MYAAFRVINPEDPALIDKIYPIIFSNKIIIVREGVVESLTEDYPTPIFLKMGMQEFSGKSNLFKISGKYDKDTGKISGDYKIAHEISSYSHRSGAVGRAQITESGTFRGQVINDHVVLNFLCKTRTGESYKKNNLGEETKTIDKCAYPIHKVAYQVVPITKTGSVVLFLNQPRNLKNALILEREWLD